MTFRFGIEQSFDLDLVIKQVALASIKNKDAMKYFENAFKAFESAEKLYNESQFSDAIKQYKKAAHAIEGCEIYELEALIWSRVAGIAYAVVFDKKLALQAFQKLIEISKEPILVASAHNSMTTIYLTFNDTETARVHAELAIKEIQSIKDDKIRMQLHGSAIFNKGEVAFRDKDYINATKCLSDASKIFDEIQHQGGQGKCFSLQGMIASARGQHNEAIVLLNNALGMFTKIDSLEEIAETKASLSVPLAHMKKFDEAISELREAAAIHRKLGQLDSATIALQAAAIIEKESRRPF